MKQYRKELRIKIREHIRALREGLSAPERAEDAEKVHTQVLHHPFLQRPRLIASYISVRGELSTPELNAALMATGHTIALPVIDPKRRGIMNFYLHQKGAPLKPGALKIPEPEAFRENLISTDLIDCMLTPLVAFDLNGNRLGMGGGFYDRILKKLSGNCLIMGLAYDFQLEPNLPRERWDMPIDEVVTPTHHYVFSQKY